MYKLQVKLENILPCCITEIKQCQQHKDPATIIPATHKHKNEVCVWLYVYIEDIFVVYI